MNSYPGTASLRLANRRGQAHSRLGRRFVRRRVGLTLLLTAFFLASTSRVQNVSPHERTRPLRKIEKVDKDIAHVSQKLGNENFMAKAPEAIVNKGRGRSKGFEQKKAALERSLKEIEELA